MASLIPSSRKVWWLIVGLVACWPLALAIDLPVARFVARRGLSGDMQRVLSWSEVFAHGIGVAILGLVVYVLDPSRRGKLPRLLATAYSAGLTADGLKLVVARIRPRYANLELTIQDTFAGWLPAVRSPVAFDHWDSRTQSLPSAHSAVAVALMFGLAGMYPRGQYLFAAFALLAAAQRIVAQAHYVSDTLAGALVGAVVAMLMAASAGPSRWFGRFECSDR